MNTKLQTPIEYLKGVGPQKGKVLREELNIHTYQDLINYFPYRYIDKTKFYKIKDLQSNSADVQLIGKIIRLEEIQQKRGKRLVATFQDETGIMELVWFKGTKWIKDNLKKNIPYVVFGKPNLFNNKFNIAHPEIELHNTKTNEVKSQIKALYHARKSLTLKELQ